MRVPDLIEPFYGWRCWTVEPSTRHGLALTSIYFPYEWPADYPALATCNLEPGSQHHGPVPGDDCICGLHAAKTIEGAVAYMPRHLRGFPALISQSTTFVLGRVKLTGDVIEGEVGFKGEKARVAELFVPSVFKVHRQPVYAAEARDALSSIYNVPAHVVKNVLDAKPKELVA